MEQLGILRKLRMDELFWALLHGLQEEVNFSWDFFIDWTTCVVRMLAEQAITIQGKAEGTQQIC
jgi:hypothetical protein